MNKILLYLRNASVTMFASGILLPLFSVKLPVVIWNILQMGGLAGLVIFGLAHHFTRTKKVECQSDL